MNKGLYKIVLTDDHAIVRQGIKMILLGEIDFDKPDEAESGDQLLELLKTNKYDMIMLDISMPGIDVFDLLDRLSSLQHNIPVLIFSMNPEEVFAKRLLNKGVAGYLNKGATTEEILKAIRKVLNGGMYLTSSLTESMASQMFRGSVKAPHEDLTQREFQILIELASGNTLTYIADKLFISKATVSNHRSALLKKLNVSNNTELIQYAIKNGLLN